MVIKTYSAAGYDTDLSDAEWALLQPLFFPPGAKRGRGRYRDPDAARACLDAIRYLLKAGCQWSLLPKRLLRCAHPAGSLLLAVSRRSAPAQEHRP
jgi:Putative transposase of IS4/5 family (DUF4096)